MARRYRGRNRSFRQNAKILLPFAVLAGLFLFSRWLDRPGKLREQGDGVYENSVTVLDVGQASCALIESEGRFCLADAGYESGTDVVTYLHDRGVEKIDLMILTHFHVDHTSEVLDIMDNFDVSALLIPDLSVENTPTNRFYSTLLDKAEEGDYKLYTAKENLKIPLGGGEIKVLADTCNTGDINDTSTCFTYEKDGFSILITGDAGAEVEKEAAENLPWGGVDFYIAGHHGSSDSSSPRLLDRAKPSVAFISCGEDNMYGHPHRETLEAFDDEGIDYYITYECGNIVCNMDDEKVYLDE